MLAAVIALLLEGYALALAWLHGLAGVQTDEAKYLLNIAYPHPPFLRWIMGQTAAWSFQEMFWRAVFATVLVQATWFVWDMTRELPRFARITICTVWLLSPSILLQGGTVMLAPMTAVTALAMLWLLHRQRRGMTTQPETWGFLWAFAILTAYQGVTLLPLIMAGTWRSSGPAWRKILTVVLPMALLAVVTLANPLALATMVIHGDEGARMTLMEHAEGALRLLIIAGGGVVGMIGVVGLCIRGRWEIFTAFALTALFVLASAPFPFYGILFLPFVVEGVLAIFLSCTACHPEKNFSHHDTFAIPFLVLLLLGWLWLKPWRDISTEPSVARETMHVISSHTSTGTITIEGSFGHQWQYESPLPLERRRPGIKPTFPSERGSALICLDTCAVPARWTKIAETPVDVWIPGDR